MFGEADTGELTDIQTMVGSRCRRASARSDGRCATKKADSMIWNASAPASTIAVKTASKAAESGAVTRWSDTPSARASRARALGALARPAQRHTPVRWVNSDSVPDTRPPPLWNHAIAAAGLANPLSIAASVWYLDS
jgi:hypothetical protein